VDFVPARRDHVETEVPGDGDRLPARLARQRQLGRRAAAHLARYFEQPALRGVHVNPVESRSSCTSTRRAWSISWEPGANAGR